MEPPTPPLQAQDPPTPGAGAGAGGNNAQATAELPPAPPHSTYEISSSFVPRLTPPSTPSIRSFSDSSSLAEAKFREDSGRWYNNSTDDYSLPADLAEVEHHALHLFFGANYLAPVPQLLNVDGDGGEGKRILDIGCGTGIWCIEMAREFPRAEVVGIDLVPIQPEDPPENVSFIHDDVTRGLPFPDGSFDLVNLRFLMSGIRDFASLFREVGRVLRPGGVVHSVEVESLWQTPGQEMAVVAPTIKQFCEMLVVSFSNRGMDSHIALRVPGHLNSTGVFGQVHTVKGHWPMSPWSSDPRLNQVGALTIRDTREFPDSARLLIIDGAGVSVEDYNDVTRLFVRELERGEARAVLPIWVSWATKT